MAVLATGRAARTDAYVVARFGVADLLRLELHTGRTHQIRVHLEHIGHPVVGDPVYAGGGSRRISGAARREAEAAGAGHAAPGASRGRLWHSATRPPARRWSSAPNGPPICANALVAAGGEELVARPDPLSYLLFFNRDG